MCEIYALIWALSIDCKLTYTLHMARKVYITKVRNTWFVVYLKRAYRGKYNAATFYALDAPYERVVEWVKNNPRLELVPDPNQW